MMTIRKGLSVNTSLKARLGKQARSKLRYERTIFRWRMPQTGTVQGDLMLIAIALSGLALLRWLGAL